LRYALRKIMVYREQACRLNLLIIVQTILI